MWDIDVKVLMYNFMLWNFLFFFILVTRYKYYNKKILQVSGLKTYKNTWLKDHPVKYYYDDFHTRILWEFSYEIVAVLLYVQIEVGTINVILTRGSDDFWYNWYDATLII